MWSSAKDPEGLGRWTHTYHRTGDHAGIPTAAQPAAGPGYPEETGILGDDRAAEGGLSAWPGSRKMFMRLLR